MILLLTIRSKCEYDNIVRLWYMSKTECRVLLCLLNAAMGEVVQKGVEDVTNSQR